MLQIVTRDFWYALPPSRETPFKKPAQHVFLTNTNTKPCRHHVYCNGMIRRIQKFNINIQRKLDIRFSFLIGGDAMVYEGRGWSAVPELPMNYRGYNYNSVYIAYLGSYTAKNVPRNMAEACVEILRIGVRDGMIEKNFDYHDIIVDDKSPYPHLM